jgi:hypothetical protein
MKSFGENTLRVVIVWVGQEVALRLDHETCGFCGFDCKRCFDSVQ